MKRLTYKSCIHKTTYWYAYIHFLTFGVCIGLLLIAVLRALFSREVGLWIDFTGFWGALNQFIDEVIFYSEPGFIPTTGYIMLKRIVLNVSHTLVLCVPLAIAIETVGAVLRTISTSIILQKYSVLGAKNPLGDSDKKSDKLFYKNVRIYDALCVADNNMLNAFVDYVSHINEMLQMGFQYGQDITGDDAIRLQQLETHVARLVSDEKILCWEWLWPNFHTNGSFRPRKSSLFAQTQRLIEKEFSREDSNELNENLHEMVDTFAGKSFFFDLDAVQEFLLNLYEFDQVLAPWGEMGVNDIFSSIKSRERLKGPWSDYGSSEGPSDVALSMDDIMALLEKTKDENPRVFDILSKAAAQSLESQDSE